MIQVSTLTGAQLDYWTARAEGVPADQLEIRQVQRSDNFHCVRKWHTGDLIIGADLVAVAYTSNPAWWAPLIEKHGITLEQRVDPVRWVVDIGQPHWVVIEGNTPQEAICRAVVRAAFGDEVEEVPCK